MLLLSAAELNSCKEAAPATPSVEQPVEVRDSVFRSLTLAYASTTTGETLPEGRSRCLDILVYDDGPSGSLDRIIRFEGNPTSIGFYCYEGAKRIAVVANSPKAFNPAALGKYSDIQLIEYSFADDSPALPVMGGTCRLDTEGKVTDCGSEAGVTVLRPLLSTIRLRSIANNLDGYELLEAPRIKLHYINSKARLFGDGNFIPEDFIESGGWADLPYDIGMFPEDGLCIDLPAYPNCTLDGSSTYQTCLELECHIAGEPHRFIFPIASIPRAATINCSIEINTPNSGAFRTGTP